MKNTTADQVCFICCSILNDDLIQKISALAIEIWTEHFTPIIGKEQVAYMLGIFQSPDSIKTQIETNYRYNALEYNGNLIGYFSWFKNDENQTIHLSKLHILRSYRRKGIARKVLSFIEEEGRKNHITCIWLTVNKRNLVAIEAYKSLGFKVTQSLDIDIGHGYSMNDYRMEKGYLICGST